MNQRLVIVSDICPILRNEPPLLRRDTDALLGDLRERFTPDAYVVGNLECPLSSADSPIPKSGPALRARPECAAGLCALGFDAMNLANNHILDHGPGGARDTIDACEQAGLSVFGAGDNLEAAARSLSVAIADHNVEILAVAEREFSIADERSAGANPFDWVDTMRWIDERRGGDTRLVVLFHGGNEYYPYPRPGLRKTFHYLADRGVDLVICQHTHCVGCHETRGDCFILYGQGNFLFDHPTKRGGEWNRGLIVQYDPAQNGEAAVELIPYTQSDEQAGVRSQTAAERETFTRALRERCDRLTDPGGVEAEWEAFAREQGWRHVEYFQCVNNFQRLMRRKLGLASWFESQAMALLKHNLVRCESHRELLLTALRQAEAERASRNGGE